MDIRLRAAIYVQENGDILVDVIPWTLSGTIRQQNLYALTFWLLVLATGLCLLALRLPQMAVPAAALAGAAGGGWLLSNGAGEGSVVWQVAPGNALMTADLAVLPVVVVVLLLTWRNLRRG